MKFNNLVEVAKKSTTQVGTVLKKYSPEIMIVAGAIGTVTAAVMACKATMKVNDILDEANKDIELLHAAEEDYEDPKEFKHELTCVYAKTGLEFAKLYAPSVALGVLSMSTVFASNNILRKRNATLTAAYGTLEGMYNRYRKNVIDTYGEEADRNMRFGIKKQEIEVTEVDKNGKEKTVKKTVDTIGPDDYSEYARFFDKSSREWDPNPEYCMTFLRAKQAYCNDRLKAKGHMFLNEVYDELGIPRTEVGQIVGWLYDEKIPNGDNYIDFGIYDLYKQNSHDFVNGYSQTILLDFNVDGKIIDKI